MTMKPVHWYDRELACNAGRQGGAGCRQLPEPDRNSLLIVIQMILRSRPSD